MVFIPQGTGPGMSRKKPGWTEPGAVIDRDEPAVESRKGTAAQNPVLSLAPTPQPPGTGRAAGSADSDADAEHPSDTRSAAEIEADIAQTRDRLAGTLDELSERLSPRAALRRANSSVRDVFVATDGSVRKDRAALTLGALLSVVGGLVAVRMRKR